MAQGLTEAPVVGAFARLDAEGIAVDVLVNDAGIQLRRPMVDLNTADWRRVIETNLTGTFVVGREAATRMIPHGTGKTGGSVGACAADCLNFALRAR